MKEITNINQKGEYHGYQERYSPTSNKLWYRGNYKNDEQIGYVESNWKGSEGIGDIATTVGFFIK